jgi:hypothetical protein
MIFFNAVAGVVHRGRAFMECPKSEYKNKWQVSPGQEQNQARKSPRVCVAIYFL